MHRKVFKTGNSIVVSLPKEMLDFLGITEGSDVDIELDKEQRRVFIASAHQELPEIDEGFARQVSEFIERYRPALEALAK